MENTRSASEIKNSLQQYIEHEPTSIKAYVADEALQHESPAQFLRDVLCFGCKCGIVGSLIYYHDTTAFFNCYYSEIEDLREEHECNYGCPLDIKGDLRNFLAWFAFEETAYQLANELGIEC